MIPAQTPNTNTLAANETASGQPTRSQRISIWLGVVVVPLIWLAHIMLGVFLVSRICGDAVAHAVPSWEAIRWIVGVSSTLAFVASLGISWAAGRAWRQILSVATGKRDSQRFIAWCGATASVAFTFGIAFSSCILVAAPIERLCAPFQ